MVQSMKMLENKTLSKNEQKTLKEVEKYIGVPDLSEEAE